MNSYRLGLSKATVRLKTEHDFSKAYEINAPSQKFCLEKNFNNFLNLKIVVNLKNLKVIVSLNSKKIWKGKYIGSKEEIDFTSNQFQKKTDKEELNSLDKYIEDKVMNVFN